MKTRPPVKLRLCRWAARPGRTPRIDDVFPIHGRAGGEVVRDLPGRLFMHEYGYCGKQLKEALRPISYQEAVKLIALTPSLARSAWKLLAFHGITPPA